MLLGPVFTLELITSVRRLRYYLVRVTYGLVLLLILWTSYLASPLSRHMPGQPVSFQEMATFANDFFNVFAMAQLAAVVLLTPAMIAGTIAQERERKTIEYLFASQLTNAEIVLSKFAARLLHVGCELLVGLPILALAMLLGGIAPALLVQTFALTLATLVAIGAMSISASVWARRSRDAVTSVYVMLLAFFLVPPLVYGISIGIPWLGWLRDVGEMLLELNSFFVLGRSFDAPPSASQSAWAPVAPLLIGSVVFTLVCLAWAVLRVRRVQRKAAGEVARRRRFTFRLLRPPLGERPMLWKELFAESSALRLGRLAWVAAALLVFVATIPAIWMFIEYLRVETAYYAGWNSAGESLIVYVQIATGIIGFLALLMILVRAGGSITAEKERDSWTSLVSTPLSPAQIVWGKIAGSWYSTRLLAVPLVLLYGLATLVRIEFVLLIVFMAVTWGVLALYVAALGMLFSLWCRTSVRAMAGSLATATFFGGGYLMCCMPLFVMGGGSGGGEAVVAAPCIPFLLGVPNVYWYNYVFNEYSHADPEWMEVAIAYILGVGAYLVAGVVLSIICVESFDSFAGRPSGLTGPPRQQGYGRPAGGGGSPLPADAQARCASEGPPAA